MHQGQFRPAVPCIRHSGLDQSSVDPSASKLRHDRCPPEPGDISDEGIAASTRGHPVPVPDEVTHGGVREGSVDVFLGRRRVAPGLRAGAFELCNVVSGTDWSHRSTLGKRADRERVVKRIPANVDGLVNARAQARKYLVDPGGQGPWAGLPVNLRCALTPQLREHSRYEFRRGHVARSHSHDRCSAVQQVILQPAQVCVNGVRREPNRAPLGGRTEDLIRGHVPGVHAMSVAELLDLGCFPGTARRATPNREQIEIPGGERFGGGAAYRNRTDDLRITRGLIPGRTPASCTDSTGNGTDDTRRAGVLR